MNMITPPPAVHPAPPSTPTPNPLDLKVHAAIARASSSVSPTALLLALIDWSSHLAGSPGKQLELFNLSLEQSHRLT
ncbi:MAG: poly-beta-hydroxybutyrate polymerase N-terminal domain-containing protein, partial [Pseudomonas sagittaria]|nr:poly-beta-hydroxybutyrate polymerase N-terminal domain-containing protein [Pseudomonas sagittaria]